MIKTVIRSLVRSLASGGVALLLSQSALAQDRTYNLTGVMGSSSGKLFAVIEDANGKQRLLTEGDELDGGLVRQISADDKSVLLAFPDREVLLTLTGSARPVAPESRMISTSRVGLPRESRISRANTSMISDITCLLVVG